MNFSTRLYTTALLALLSLSGVQAQESHADILVYGGTSGGIAAAIQAKRMGASVILIEPGDRIGGLTTGGLGQTDIGKKEAIGGISLEFYQGIRKHYDQPEAWKWQKKEEYEATGQSKVADNAAMWTFEPSAALTVFEKMIADAAVPVIKNERLDRLNGVEKDGARIVSITMESGKKFTAGVFIDATYEGDLLASAGVHYTVGRESNDAYGETLNGVQTQHATSHQLQKGIDPYLTKGDAASGLLPGVDPSGPGQEGARDHRVQAYCYRMCLTNNSENRIPFEKPDAYNEQWYELLLRNFEAGEKAVPWINSAMPNAKTDTNNCHGVSTDFIGQNYAYPEADYATRDAIAARHLLYQRGLMWTLANHERVPESIRAQVSQWGMTKDEFTENGGWQKQLYIREARRMVGAQVMTQHHCQGREKAENVVGLAAYTMDSHNVQRYVDANGHARNEGDVQVGGFPPYGIAYAALTPKPEQCTNLLVPVCLSASHIAFGSIRMEPVFMVLGQSAATAAVQSIEQKSTVQAIDFAKLRERLLADKQVLEWSGTPGKGIDPKKLEGIVMDDKECMLAGFPESSSAIGPYVGEGYRHDNNEKKGLYAALFLPFIPEPGLYEVRIAYTADPNRATNVPIEVGHVGGRNNFILNQQKTPPIDGTWISVGKFIMNPGRGKSWVQIKNDETDGVVVIDAVQFILRQP